MHTVGWGHAVDSHAHGWFEFKDGSIVNLYDFNTKITLAQAEEILETDVREREKQIYGQLYDRRIAGRVDQHFFDALFLLIYQNGINQLTRETDLSKWLTEANFDPNDEQEIKEQFGEYTNKNSDAAKLRRLDELDIIFYGEYDRDEGNECLNRYGDIWRKKTERREAAENQK